MIKARKNLTPAALAALMEGDDANVIRAMTPGGIEAQEAEGQLRFVSSPILPRQCLGCTRADLEALGIVFGDEVDELFIKAKLPDGWIVRPTDHSMWSELIDSENKVRALMFFKAAFYDKHAHISLCKE